MQKKNFFCFFGCRFGGTKNDIQKTKKKIIISHTAGEESESFSMKKNLASELFHPIMNSLDYHGPCRFGNAFFDGISVDKRIPGMASCSLSFVVEALQELDKAHRPKEKKLYSSYLIPI